MAACRSTSTTDADEERIMNAYGLSLRAKWR